MAITINWYRGDRAALGEAIAALDVRLAAVEAAVRTGALPAVASVAGVGVVSAVNVAPAAATVRGAGAVTARYQIGVTASVAGAGSITAAA